MKSVVRILAFLSFLLMLISPTVFQVPRGVIIVVTVFLMLIGYCFLNFKQKFASEALIINAVCIAVSVCSLVIGVANNNPGALPSVTVYILWPVLFIWLAGFIKEYHFLDELCKIIDIGVTVNFIVLVALFLGGLVADLGFINEIILNMGGRAGINEEGLEFSLPTMGVFIYAFGYYAAKLYLFNSQLVGKRALFNVDLMIFIMCIFALLSSGRRGFWLAAIVGILALIVIGILSEVRRLRFKDISRVSAYLFIWGIFFSWFLEFLGIDLTIYIDAMLSGFSFDDSANSSATRRKVQFYALIEGWSQSPIFGAGLGASANERTEFNPQPWAYELQYVALLFQFGLLGFLVYLSGITWMIFRSIYLSAKDFDFAKRILPLIVGLICILSANATNPYISKFDYLWTIFLPLAYLNVRLSKSRP